jgi:diguanylate cyclase (GGDEF)-like protein
MQFNYKNVKLNQRWLVLAVCLIGVLLVWAATNVSVGTPPSQIVSKGTLYVNDSNTAFDIDAIRTLPDNSWQVETREQMSFGMADNPYWFKFELQSDNSRSERLLEIDYALLDKVDIWFFSEGKLLSDYTAGDSYVFHKRLIKHEKLLFPLPSVDTDLTVYMKVITSGTLRLPLRVWEKDNFLLFNGEHSVVLGVFFGFLAAMALSNLFFFITTRSFTFLSYSGYVVSVGLTLATLHGLGYKYLWPDNIWLQARSIGIFATATTFFAMIFTLQLLNVKAHSQFLYRVVLYASMVCLLGILTSMLIPYSIYIKIYLVLLLVCVLIIFMVGIILWKRGVLLARFYTLAWTALLASAMVASLDNWNIILFEFPSHYLLMFGATVETFLLALALALSYSHQRQELFETQELALQRERLAREAQENIVKVKEEAREDLEYKVEERTLELNIALRELSETNRELEKKNTMDSLTGIRNRYYFDKKYLAEVRRSRREKTQLSIVMLDIDRFKSVNDQYGHLVGDECIRHVANLIKQGLKRPSDDACRYGGEEFALILPNTDQAGALQLTEAIRQQIEAQPVTTLSGSIKLTISAGISTSVIQAVIDETQLLENADKALYQAKNNGRNQVCVSEMTAQSSAKQEQS